MTRAHHKTRLQTIDLALLRVATPATERACGGAAAGQNLRTLEALVATHQNGDSEL